MLPTRSTVHALKTSRNIAASLLCTLALLLTSAAQAESAPDLFPFEVSYGASMEKGVSLNGSAKRILTSQGNDVWLYRTEVKSFIADLDESLVLKWEDGKVVPLRYRYRLSGLLIKDRKQSIDFDWKAGVATGDYRGKSFKVELQEGILDPLGFQVQLHQDVLNGKREMEYQVLDRGKIDSERFAVVNDDASGTDDSRSSLLKAEKIRENSKRETLMWFDPDSEFVLVRLLQVEPDGSKYELKLKSVDLGG
ncbi:MULTISPECIES: DUF3108 domain-containing protein [Marinobacter]|uniref:DUF3108 domain-containing protein n=1 Tax=Marinobacter xiaoshiensis TaxID=3073652 RepID=A0ABU2HGL8_9GAMM|nr:DUF3108 domain-containing protein [Marinobacter sp. F60267]MDS1310199.1 DUF3108 domain-containing protein [Marinobacter sp. F60267]